MKWSCDKSLTNQISTVVYVFQLCQEKSHFGNDHLHCVFTWWYLGGIILVKYNSSKVILKYVVGMSSICKGLKGSSFRCDEGWPFAVLLLKSFQEEDSVYKTNMICFQWRSAVSFMCQYFKSPDHFREEDLLRHRYGLNLKNDNLSCWHIWKRLIFL
jgi:hypothetical protein